MNIIHEPILVGFNTFIKSVLIKADSQGAIALIKNPRFYIRTKHIDIQWHFVRDQVETGIIQFEWIPTRDITADGLTQALTNEKFIQVCIQACN